MSRYREIRNHIGAALAGQAPLHRQDAAGIAAGGDDVEIAARLTQSDTVALNDTRME